MRCYGENASQVMAECCPEIVNKLWGTWCRRSAPNQSTIQRLFKEFKETGSIVDIKSPWRRRSGRTFVNIAGVEKFLVWNRGHQLIVGHKNWPFPKALCTRCLTYLTNSWKSLATECLQVSTDPRTQKTDHMKCQEFNNSLLESQDVDSLKETRKSLSRHISRNLPTRSCDFTLCDFFL